MRIEVVSDVVCPWCYIGKRRLEKALADFGGDVEVVYRPYQLDPSATSDGTPLKEALGRRYSPQAVPRMIEHAASAGRSEGLEMDWDRAIAASTFDAHRLMGLVLREHGAEVQRALADGLFEAHFVRGLNVGDRGVLADLANEAGMDRAQAAAFLASDEGVKETREQIDEARSWGIGGVPTFIIDQQYMIEGAQPAPLIRQALEQISAGGDQLTARDGS
jgi:predicted DsbA family dithiol-disulfide isomerase